MISTCSLLTHTLSTCTTPSWNVGLKSLFPLALPFLVYLNLATTSITPSTPNQFRRLAVLLARWGDVGFFLSPDLFTIRCTHFSGKQTKSKFAMSFLFSMNPFYIYGNSHAILNLKAVRCPSPASHWFSPQLNSFVRAKAELELAQYMLKSDDLMLHPEFLQRLRSLPQSYLYGEYRQIYRDYGTHYITEATLGGDYEHTIILNKENLAKTGNN